MDTTKFRHPAWGVVVLPLALAVGATFTPEVIRGLLLIAAVIAATWTFYKTEFANRRKKHTAVAGFLFLLVAGLVFILGHSLDSSAKAAQTKKEALLPSSNVAADSSIPKTTPGVKSLPTEQSLTPPSSRPTPARAVPPHAVRDSGKEASTAHLNPGSISQNNSGGVNVQQGTTGNNSPIINSPITIGTVPKSIQPQDMIALRAFCEQAPKKATVEIYADQFSRPEDTLPDDFYRALKAAGWLMADQGVSHEIALSAPAPGKRFQGAVIRTKGEALRLNEIVHFDRTEPLFYIVNALRALNVPITIRRDPSRAEGLITIGFEGGLPQ